MVEPSNTSACLTKGRLVAVLVPSNFTLRWLPSQYGLFLEWPQRQRCTSALVSMDFDSSQSQDKPSSFGVDDLHGDGDASVHVGPIL